MKATKSKVNIGDLVASRLIRGSDRQIYLIGMVTHKTYYQAANAFLWTIEWYSPNNEYGTLQYSDDAIKEFVKTYRSLKKTLINGKP